MSPRKNTKRFRNALGHRRLWNGQGLEKSWKEKTDGKEEEEGGAAGISSKYVASAVSGRTAKHDSTKTSKLCWP